MTDSHSDYVARLKSIYAGPAGELVYLDVRQFEDDVEAHDPELQERYWTEMLANFEFAVEQCSKLWGHPNARIRYDHADADSWMDRTQVSFVELACWPRADGKHFFVAINHEDRECPILIMSGVTI